MGMGVILAAALFSSASETAARIATDGQLNFKGYHEVRVDENFAAAYIDGKPATITVITPNFIELRGNHIVVSLTKKAELGWEATWTGRHREHGVLTPGLKRALNNDTAELLAYASTSRQVGGTTPKK
ncbi:hypothetical protein BSPA111_26520 [Buttiauxella sp. A111]|nr:hypothetical protein BSPA111_26520 [Buttiauxella sp. A111]